MSANDNKPKRNDRNGRNGRNDRDGLTAGFRFCRVDHLSADELAYIEHRLVSGEAANLQPAPGKLFTLYNFNRTITGSLDEIAFFIWITIRGPENTGQTRWKYDSSKSMLYAYNSDGREFWKRSTKQALPEALRPIIGTEVKAGRLKIPQEEQDIMFAKVNANGDQPAAVQETPAEEPAAAPEAEVETEPVEA